LSLALLWFQLAAAVTGTVPYPNGRDLRSAVAGRWRCSRDSRSRWLWEQPGELRVAPCPAATRAAPLARKEWEAELAARAAPLPWPRVPALAKVSETAMTARLDRATRDTLLCDAIVLVRRFKATLAPVSVTMPMYTTVIAHLSLTQDCSALAARAGATTLAREEGLPAARDAGLEEAVLCRSARACSSLSPPSSKPTTSSSGDRS
jgi:hypothetical protein